MKILRLVVLGYISFLLTSCTLSQSDSTSIRKSAGDSKTTIGQEQTNGAKKLTKLKFLEKYDGQKTNELIALEVDHRKDSIVMAFEQAVQKKAQKKGMNSLSEEEVLILVIQALEREVNNGGYEQFFLNPSKKFTPMIVDALNRIGSLKTAAITQQAIDALGIEGKLTIDKIDNIIYKDDEQLIDLLDKCDTQYYKTAGSLSDPLFNFIKQNRDKIHLNF